MEIGEVVEIRLNDKKVDEADVTTEVSVNIRPTDRPLIYDKHFDNNDVMFTKLTKNSLGVLKLFKDEFKTDLRLLTTLVKMNEIS